MAYKRIAAHLTREASTILTEAKHLARKVRPAKHVKSSTQSTQHTKPSLSTPPLPAPLCHQPASPEAVLRNHLSAFHRPVFPNPHSGSRSWAKVLYQVSSCVLSQQKLHSILLYTLSLRAVDDSPINIKLIVKHISRLLKE